MNSIDPVAKCCFIDCDKPAVVELWDKQGNTHACADHIEDLKSDDSEVHDFHVPGDCDTISETPRK